MRAKKYSPKLLYLSSEVSQKDLFDERYEDFYNLLEELVTTVYNEESTINIRERIIGFLVDSYSTAFLEEISYILDELNVPTTPQDIINISNGVDVSAYIISNRGRIREILINHEIELNKRLNEIDKSITSLETFVEQYKHRLVTLAISEIHLGIEKASVQGSKLLQEITGVRLKKVWNCVGDGNSCKTCLAMHGTEVYVDEPFVTDFSGLTEGLSYTGGDVPYAHPRCRCWLTYIKA